MNRRPTILMMLVIGVSVIVLALAVGITRAQPPSPSAGWEEGRSTTQEEVQFAPELATVPTQPGTYYRTVSGTRFVPTSSAMTYNALGGAIYATELPPGGFSFSVDFDLPPGAQITEVVFFVIDNDASANMSMQLRSYNPESDAFALLESASTSGATAALQTIVIAVDPQIQVEHATTAYRLRVVPGVASTKHLLRGARIGYTVPIEYLPMLMK